MWTTKHAKHTNENRRESGAWLSFFHVAASRPSAAIFLARGQVCGPLPRRRCAVWQRITTHSIGIGQPVDGFANQVLKVGPAIFLGLLGFLCSLTAWSQSASPWRVFRSDDGLSETAVTSVPVSSRGNVWMTHATATEASVFDGYAIRHIPAPEENGRM